MLLFHLTNIHYTFALKKETIWAEWVETKNANVVVCLVSSFSDKKNVKTCNIKNNNFKCA